MSFRVNVDYPTRRATIHTVNDDGRCQPHSKRPQDGGWLGPFDTVRTATQAARESRLRVHPCRVCNPRLSAVAAQRPELRVEKEIPRPEPEILAVPEQPRREPVRLGRTLGSAAYSVAKEAENRHRTAVQQERILTEAATEMTQIWAGLEERLLAAQSSDFGDDEVLRRLRHEATENRISALGTVSAYARVAGFASGIYKPVYDIFREMADIQVEVFDTVLWACDSRESGDLEYAIVSTRYCQSLGEQALLMMPELAQRRKQEDGDHKRGCVWVGVGLVALVALVIVVASIGR